MLVRNNLAALASGGIVAAAALPVLPRLHAGLPALDVGWVDATVTLTALGLLAVFACYLSARPLLSQSPASLLTAMGDNIGIGASRRILR